MQEPVNSALAVGWGAFTAVVAFLFNVPVPVVIAAFGGAALGVGMSGVVSYARGAFLALIVTTASCFLTPLLNAWMGRELPDRGLAFVLAFVLIFCRQQIMKRLKRIVGGKEKIPGGLA